MKKSQMFLLACLCAVSAAAQDSQSSTPAVPDARYATDAYPGFDTEKDEVSPSRKEPRWFSWFTGPDCDAPDVQMQHCRLLEADGRKAKAARQYDALVRNWPTSAEAPEAQLRLAELREEECDWEEAFEEFRYLLDFYSLKCDYKAVADRLYGLAGEMRKEGKTIVFFRFRNTVDVRRAFESAVLRAPGASWAPAALLTIAELREEEGRDGEAVKVYENLRNIHFGSLEAKTAIPLEAAARMRIFREHAYNRDRGRDTIRFLELAARACGEGDKATIEGFLAEARGMSEEEAWRSASFYDSRMRTRRSAVTALERFIEDYPGSVHADEARARLKELKGDEEK